MRLLAAIGATVLFGFMAWFVPKSGEARRHLITRSLGLEPQDLTRQTRLAKLVLRIAMPIAILVVWIDYLFDI